MKPNVLNAANVVIAKLDMSEEQLAQLGRIVDEVLNEAERTDAAARDLNDAVACALTGAAKMVDDVAAGWRSAAAVGSQPVLPTMEVLDSTRRAERAHARFYVGERHVWQMLRALAASVGVKGSVIEPLYREALLG